MLKIFRLLTFAAFVSLAGVMTARTAAGVKKPDFAYPETVSAQASKSLDSALAKGDDVGILRSLLDYTLARVSISADNLPACLAEIDSVKDVRHDSVLSGLLSTLEAELYNNVYTRSQWKYDRRTAPLFPIPTDYNEWTGEQFRYKISSLIDSAIADSVALRAVPLGIYKNAIKQERMTSIYYPTLYDFVTACALQIMSGWGDESKPRVLAMYDSLIAGSKPASAPGVNVRIGRLEYDWNHNPQIRSILFRRLSPVSVHESVPLLSKCRWPSLHGICRRHPSRDSYLQSPIQT